MPVRKRAWSRAALILSAAFALASAEGCHERGAVPPERWNVLLISVDTLRADRLNCYGYARRRTSPNIDAFARDAILFENHNTVSPWTTPSHLSLLTSLLPSHHGVVSSMRQLHRSIEGKQAFDGLASERLTLAEALAATGRATAAFTGGLTMDPRLGFGQGFERYETSMVKLSPRAMQPMYDWIEQHRSRPFFLFWHSFEVHAPYLSPDFLPEVLPADRAEKLGRALVRLGKQSNASGIEADMGIGRTLLARHGAETVEVCDALYDGGIKSFDEWFGRLISLLRSQGLYERTLIVLTSDHGEQLGERSGEFYNFHGRSLYREMIHVPLIVRIPGASARGVRVPALTASIDVMPTILDLVGGRPAQSEMEGASLRPLWEQPKAAGREYVVSEALADGPEQKCVQTDRYKMVFVIDLPLVKERGRAFLPERPSRVELYDRAHDPSETADLASGSPPADVRDRVAAMTRTLRQTLGGRVGRTEKVQLDADVMQGLKALGYVE